MTRIWIDPSSGSWGAGKTVDYDVTDDELEYLENASDTEITAFAVRLIREGR